MVNNKDKSYVFLFIIMPLVLSLIIAITIAFRKKKTIKIGILHSITGSLASSERPAIDAKLLAISEINAAGGVLGCQLEPIIADGQSSEDAFRLAAYDLVTHHKVAAIFGCYTSSSRKAVKEIVEKYNNLLFHGDQFEGLELSKNAVYTGMAGNHNFPMLLWAAKTFGAKIFLVGSMAIDSAAFMQIIKQFALLHEISIVGESLMPLGSDDVDAAIDSIQLTQPNVIINAIDGYTNISFFKKLKNVGVTSNVIPVVTISFSEDFFEEIGAEYLEGNYIWSGYFQSIPTMENKLFLQKVENYFGIKKVVSDVMISEYANIYLWAKAAEEAKSATDTAKIVEKLKNTSLNTPFGPLLIDENNYVSRRGIMAKVSKGGECQILWQTSSLIPSIPFPTTSSQQEWEIYLKNQFKEWGNKWERSV